MNILVLSDDKWHPNTVVKEGLSFLDTEENIITWIQDPNIVYGFFKFFKLIIIAKSNNISFEILKPWMSLELEQQLDEFVLDGGILLTIHSGTSGYKGCSIYRSLIGGVFDNHSDPCMVTYTLNDGTCFTVFDEHYFMVIDNPDELDIFLTSSSQFGKEVSGWRKSYGRGKVIVLTPGHNLDVWRNPIFQEMILWHILH